MTAIAAEKYVRLTTFTKDGRPKYVPIWIAELEDGTVGFTTGSDSWKAKRIRNSPTVELAPSTFKGVVADGATTSTGTAKLVTGVEFDSVNAAIKGKYGFMVTMVTAVEKVRALVGKGDGDSVAVVITVDET